jgi:hypothetical protein
MISSLTTLDRAKLASTGVGLRPVQVGASPVCNSVADFVQLVSTYYKLFREELSNDVVFLRGFKKCQPADQFDAAIHLLRTASQHSTDVRARAFFDKWLAEHSSSQAAADTLFELLGKALDGLASNAVLASRNDRAREQWRDIVATDVSAVMISVMADLGLAFSAGQRGFFVRQVEGRLKVEPGTGPREAVVKDYSVQALVSKHTPLPVSYVEVLDHLGLLSDVKAEGAVLVAYSVASVAPGLNGDAFLERVEETWRAAAAF